MVRGGEGFGGRAVLRIVLVYALFAALWIFITDSALLLLVRNTAVLTRLAMVKGVFFILVTGGLLFLMIRGNSRRIARIDQARRDSEARFRSYVHNAPVAVLVFDRGGRCVDFNPAAAQLLGYTAEQLTRESLAPARAAQHGLSGLQELARQAARGSGELAVPRADGREIWVSLSAAPLNETLHLVFCQDVTARRQAAAAAEATLELLRICNQARDSRELLLELTVYFQRLSGCEAVGVRLRRGEDYPYYETRGFPAEFVQLENSLCAVDAAGEAVRDCEGAPVLECMCGNILCGRFDPAKSFFTNYGSFWSSATTELLAGTTEQERLARMRNRCNRAGYESVALIPLRTRERAFGLFQFNDRRAGRFTAESVAFLEGLVSYTAIALSKLETERELGESGQFSRQVIESAAEGVVVYGPDLRYLTWNPFMERLTGLPASGVLGRTPDELFPFLRKAGAVDRARRALAGETPPPVDVPFEIPQTGRKGWTVNSYAPLRNASGAIIGVIATIRDITARRQAEEALRETTRRLELAMASDNLGTWAWDIAADALHVDDRVLELFGQKRESFGGRLADWEGALHPEDRDATRVSLAAALRQERDFQLEYRILRSDAQVRSIRTNALVIRDAGGRALRAIGLIKDVTAEKDLEERLRQAQKMESVGRLAGGVAHDFNNMLQVIGSYVELVLQKTDPSKPAHQHLLQVQKAAQRSSELTGQLLAFARKQAVSPRVLDLNEAVAGTLRMLQRLIGEDIELSWSPGPDLGQVRMDPSQLDQVLANLAVNARDAINGPGTLSIRTSAATVDREAAGRNPDASPGDYILLAVSDDGCGMDKETLSHLFEPFFTTKEAGKGTGLGLATVYGIVRQNNGFLTVESSPGLGSVFRVYLPRLAGTAATRSGAAEQAPLRGVETILLVEDEASILELARMLLEELGYKVLAAGGAKEALELAGKNPGPIHLLLTDVVMPRMNGPELASRLAALRPGLRCLYMSGYAEGPGARGPSLELDYLRKPFTLTDLSRKVREVLDRPAARPEARPEAAWRPEASGQGRGGIDESLPQR